MNAFYFVLRTTIIFTLGLAIGISARTPAPKPPKQYPLWNFDEIGPSCRAKGRLQDRGYCGSHLMDRVVADGKDAIPVLISQLTETRPSKTPIYDYWSVTTSGDIAYFILNDLFTDADWETFTMPGLESLREPCDSDAQSCWQIFLKKHGRKFVQGQWTAAWNKYKERVHWDENARCFRLAPERGPN
jgi:hypothetical protein